MRGLCLVVAIVIAASVARVASADAGASKMQSHLKDWPGPDASLKLKLENNGKRSTSGRDLNEHESVAYSLFQQKRYEEAAREYQKCAELNPRDLHAHLGLGYSLYNLRRYDEAASALKKAQELWPDAYKANLWLGVTLSHLGRFKEAIPPLKKAIEAGKEDKFARRELFSCYLIAGEVEKVLGLYPRVFEPIGNALVFMYFGWLALLLPFSLPIRNKVSPGFWFSVAWLALFLEGQIAFSVLLSSLPSLRTSETVLTGAALAGLPFIIVAVTSFVRQPWGEPFRWPMRLGKPKVMLISLLLLLLTFSISVAFSQLYVQLAHKPFPLQRTIPLIQNALRANVVIAWLAVGFVAPLVEEILFRGLLFGAFEKRWGIRGAMLGSSFLFACVHFQIVVFPYLFCFGLILGWARSQCRSLGLPIVVHSLNNMLALLALTLSPGTGPT